MCYLCLSKLARPWPPLGSRGHGHLITLVLYPSCSAHCLHLYWCLLYLVLRGAPSPGFTFGQHLTQRVLWATDSLVSQRRRWKRKISGIGSTACSIAEVQIPYTIPSQVMVILIIMSLSIVCGKDSLEYHTQYSSSTTNRFRVITERTHRKVCWRVQNSFS